MIFHENRLLADDSHEISYLIFFRKYEKMSKNLSSAAIGALRVNYLETKIKLLNRKRIFKQIMSDQTTPRGAV